MDFMNSHISQHIRTYLIINAYLLLKSLSCLCLLRAQAAKPRKYFMGTQATLISGNHRSTQLVSNFGSMQLWMNVLKILCHPTFFILVCFAICFRCSCHHKVSILIIGIQNATWKINCYILTFHHFINCTAYKYFLKVSSLMK